VGEYGLAEAALGARWKAGGMCGGVRDDQRGERWGMVHGAWCTVHGGTVHGAWGMVHGARTQRLMYLQGTSEPAWYRLDGESLMPSVYRKGTPLEKSTKSAKEALRSTGLETASTATWLGLGLGLGLGSGSGSGSGSGLANPNQGSRRRARPPSTTRAARRWR
jgi:hypothetical protein